MARFKMACGGTENSRGPRRSQLSSQGKIRTRHLELRFLGDVSVDGIHEDEFLAPGAFITQPTPFECTLVAEIMYLLDGTRHELCRFRDPHAHRWTPHAQSQF